MKKNIFTLVLAFTLIAFSFLNASADQKNKNMLRIAGPYTQEVIDAFSSLNPDVKLEFGDDKWVNSDEMMRAMVTKDTQYDVYYISMDWGFDAIKAKRFCADLSSSQVLAGFVQSVYPQVREVVADGDYIAALPAMLNLKLMAVNQDLLKSLPEGTMPKDYAAYLSLLLRSEELRESMDINVIAGAPDRYTLMTELLRQYVLKHEAEGEPLMFDDEAFIKAAEMIAQFPEETFLSEEDYDKLAKYPTLFNPNPQPMDSAGGETGEALMPIPPLSEDEDPVVEANLDMWIINPHSTNIPLAVSFLECAAQAMPVRDRMILCPDVNDPVADEAFETRREKTTDDLAQYQKKLEDASLEPLQKKELQEKIETLEAFMKDDMNKWAITPDEISSYRKAAPYTVLPSKSLFLGFDMGSAIVSLTEITDQYLAGKLSVKQMVDSLNQKAQMLYLENR